ncbi:MAG TPA: hypothetical protein VGD78_21670 [Chthoniobacterales bacterium]
MQKGADRTTRPYARNASTPKRTVAEALEKLYLAKVALIPRLLAAAFAIPATDKPANPASVLAHRAEPELKDVLLACVDRELEAVKRLGRRLADLNREVPLPKRAAGPDGGQPEWPWQPREGAHALLVEALADAHRALQAVREGDVLTVDLLVDLVGEERQAGRELQALAPEP